MTDEELGFIKGMKFAKTVCSWYEGFDSEVVSTELDNQIFQAEQHGFKDEVPFCKKIEGLKIVNKAESWLE